jgi:hypothetical protein
MGIPRPAGHERRRVWPASPSHVKRRECPSCRGVVGDEVAVASGSSMRPRIPKNAPGTPVHGSAFLKSAHGIRRVLILLPRILGSRPRRRSEDGNLKTIVR